MKKQDQNISKQNKKVKYPKYPARMYPQLANHLVEISIIAAKLNSLTLPGALGDVIGISRQAMQQRIDRKKGNHE